MDLAAPLAELATALKAAGIKQASADPADLNRPPYVYLKLSGVDLDLLQGYIVNLDAVCVAPKTGTARSLDALGDLLDTVLGVVETEETITTATYVPPTGSALPALVVPVRLVVTP